LPGALQGRPEFSYNPRFAFSGRPFSGRTGRAFSPHHGPKTATFTGVQVGEYK
jgi:hypothetical protein